MIPILINNQMVLIPEDNQLLIISKEDLRLARSSWSQTNEENIAKKHHEYLAQLAKEYPDAVKTFTCTRSNLFTLEKGGE